MKKKRKQWFERKRFESMVKSAHSNCIVTQMPRGCWTQSDEYNEKKKCVESNASRSFKLKWIRNFWFNLAAYDTGLISFTTVRRLSKKRDDSPVDRVRVLRAYISPWSAQPPMAQLYDGDLDVIHVVVFVVIDFSSNIFPSQLLTLPSFRRCFLLQRFLFFFLCRLSHTSFCSVIRRRCAHAQCCRRLNLNCLCFILDTNPVRSTRCSATTERYAEPGESEQQNYI